LVVAGDGSGTTVAVRESGVDEAGTVVDSAFPTRAALASEAERSGRADGVSVDISVGD